MEYPLEKYKRFIEDTEASLFDKHGLKWIKIHGLTRMIYVSPHLKYSPNVVAKIVKSGRGFAIRYVCEGFNKIYEVKNVSSVQIRNKSMLISVIYKLRRISSRNSLTHKILEEVIKYQRRYLETTDPIDLVPLSQVQLTRFFSTRYSLLATKADNSWTSRLVSRLSIITPSGEEKPLKWFFPTERGLNKRLIRQLFDNEQKIGERQQKSDREVKGLLKDKFDISVSRRTICYCRKELGILPFTKRQLGDGYSAFAANFSHHYPLALEAIVKYAPAKSGVYELGVGSFSSLRMSDEARRLKAEGPRVIARGTKQSQDAVFYIGSAKDIRKRLKGHLGQNRNGGIKEILKNSNCFFRYILFQKDWRKEEKKLYDLFVQTFGIGPKCNRVRPGGI